MKLSEEAWVRLPLRLLKSHGVTKSAAMVCAVIVDRATSAAELYDWVTVSVPDLMSDTGCSRSTVKRAVEELERLALIEVEHNRTTGKSNRYKLSGCVELCGKAAAPKQRGTRKAQLRAAKELQEAREREEMEAYMSLSNRFLGGDDDHD